MRWPGGRATLRWALIARWYRPVAFGLTALLLAWAGTVWWVRWGTSTSHDAIALDYRTFVSYGQRFLATGSLYLPSQLAGPYEWRSLPADPAVVPYDPATLPCVYPPLLAYLVVPAALLPAPLWWLMPLGTIAFCLWQWRPAPWKWPILAAVAGLPNTASLVIVGGSTMWIIAFAAAGLRWHWPAALAILKPSLGPLALIGVRHRSWWLAVGVLVILSLPLAAEWVRFILVVANAHASPFHSFDDLPLVAAVLIAYSARRSDRVPEHPHSAAAAVAFEAPPDPGLPM